MLTENNRNVLIIGGAGFIGSALAESCIASGMNVRIVDMLAPAGGDTRNEIDFVQGDYRDSKLLQNILEDIDYVAHLAHDTLLLDIACDMSAEIKRNVLPAVQLMEACSETDVSKLLFVSSGGTVYGNPDINQPIEETRSLHPVSVYGTTKLMIESLGHVYFAQKNLPFIVARPGNAYGIGQVPFRGQGFIATALASAKLGMPMSVYGDGSAVRDYIYITDIADAIVALMQNGIAGEAYNIGTSVGTSLRQLIDEYINPVIEADNFRLEFEFKPERRADVNYNVLSNSKLLRDTGFTPGKGLADGIRETWEWIKSSSQDFEK